MNDVIELWGEKHPEDIRDDAFDAEKIIREVGNKTRKRGHLKRRAGFLIAAVFIVAVLGITAAAASGGLGHYPAKKETESESETERRVCGIQNVIGLRLGYLPEDMEEDSEGRLLSDYLAELGKACDTLTEEELESLHFNYSAYSDGVSAERIADAIAAFAGGWDEEAREEALKAIRAYLQEITKGIDEDKSKEENEKALEPYVKAVMVLPGLEGKKQEEVFDLIAAVRARKLSVSLFSVTREDVDLSEKESGPRWEAVWRKEINGRKATFITVEKSEIKTLVLYDPSLDCVAEIVGEGAGITEEELVMIAEGLELIETDVNARPLHIYPTWRWQVMGYMPKG